MALLFLTILYHKLLPSQFIFHVLFYVAYCNTTVYNLINIVHRKEPNMKSASVNVRINENIKQHAESILEDTTLFIQIIYKMEKSKIFSKYILYLTQEV